MESISKRQLYLIGTTYALSTTLLGVLVQVIQKSKADAWLTAPVAALFVLLALWLLAGTARRFPGQDLFAALSRRHPVIGRGVGLLYMLFFFVLLCRDFRMLVLFINMTLLEFTPLFVVALLILVCAVYMARGGLEVLARNAEWWIFLLLASFVIVPLLLVSEFQPHNLLPLLYNGFIPVLHGSWYLFPYFGEMIVLAFIIGHPTFNMKTTTKGLLISGSAILIAILCALLVLSANVASRINFPVYETVRQIHLTDFLDRLELPFVAVWMPAVIIKVALGTHVLGHGMQQMFPVLSARELILPFGTLALACSFWLFRDLSELLLINRPWPFVALVFQFVIPLLLFLFLRPGRKRKSQPSET